MKSLIIFIATILFPISVFSSNSMATLLESEKRLIESYQKSVPGVVNVSNVREFRDFFLGSQTKQEVGAGSGFIWDKEGHIVTNFHVVQDNKSQLMISFFNSKNQVMAKVIGVEPKLDIAVLKVDKLPDSAKPITIGHSKDLKVGQMAMALGNPFGLDHTMTMGIISALGRKIAGVGGVNIYDMVQTDADINPGNSGGPLLNSSGEVIGMNTLIYSSSGSSAGLGFAVPIDSIKQVVPDLIKFGKVIRPALGIIPLPEQYMNHLASGENGVMIASIPDGNNAEKAGLKGIRRDRIGRLYLGDIIKKIDDHKVENLDDIFHLLENYKIGDEVTLTIKKDDGKTVKVKLILQST